ncbi:uncharacterized protein LOC143917730 [Arctopsyche grandis]|uniref:uncharacterized protein LOC143917730 n=1 Tax=Arctopsyche grandis TaxID=121162 RepID=UPI00406D7CAD
MSNGQQWGGVGGGGRWEVGGGRWEGAANLPRREGWLRGWSWWLVAGGCGLRKSLLGEARRGTRRQACEATRTPPGVDGPPPTIRSPLTNRRPPIGDRSRPTRLTTDSMPNAD